MTSWNERDRTRSFLAAALVTAVCGAIFSTTDSTPRLAASGMAPRAGLSRPAAETFSSSDPSAPLDPLVAEAPGIADAEDRAEMKDAVGGPSLAAPSLAAGPAGASGAWIGAARAAASPAGGAPADSAARLAAQRLAAASSALSPLKHAALPRRERASDAAASGRSPLEGSAPRAPVRAVSERAGEARAAGAPEPSSQIPFSTSDAESLGAQAGPAPAGAAGAAAAAPAAGKPRLTAFKPALLSKLLGPKPLRPPRGAVRAPAANPWKEHPAPEGCAPMTAREAEGVAPPASARRAEKLEGVKLGGRWAWLERSGERVWLWPSPEGPALLSHEGHWWWQSRGVWFLLHDGEPWGWRYLNEWRREGLVHASGAQMIYSDDGRRVGIVAPGEGAVLYDATSGAELGRWSADQLPRARAGKAPSRLRLP